MQWQQLRSLLGEDFHSDAIQVASGYLGTCEVQDDPPDRIYLAFPNTGLDLLFEHDKLIDLQFYVQPHQEVAGFVFELPYGLTSGMSQNDVHQLLGEPASSNETMLRYDFLNDDIKLVINVGPDGAITRMSMARHSLRTVY